MPSNPPGPVRGVVRRPPPWSAVVAALLVALLAFGTTAALAAHANRHFAAEIDLARSLALIQRTKGIQEQIEAGHEITPALLAERRDLDAELTRRFDRLVALEQDDPLGFLEWDTHTGPSEVRDAWRRYATDAAEVARLYEAGRAEEGRRWDEERADPAY
jgi:hypothetical protein